MKTVEVPAVEGGQTYAFGDPRPIGDETRAYYVKAEYRSSQGLLRVIFLDQNQSPIKLLREDRLKATLKGPDGKLHEFSFWYPPAPLWYFSSYRVVGNRQPPVNNYTVQEDWLKDLSSFRLRVWIPLGNNIYIVNFDYP